MKTLCVILLCLCPLALSAKKAADDEERDTLGYSWLPIIGLDDKTGWLYGGALFIDSDVEPGINAGIFGVTNLSDFHSITFNYDHRTAGPWSYGLHTLIERAFDNYYGEGDLTSPVDPYRMSIYHFELKPALLFKVYKRLRVGVFDDFRSRIESGIERVDYPQGGDPSRLFPDEATNAIGARLEWDTRDRVLNPRSGDYYQLSVTRSPPDWSSWPDPRGFTQVLLDLRQYRKFRPDIIEARRGLIGTTYGDASYLFRYRLGGLDLLRGYKENRFRGTSFFIAQDEYRWTPFKWIGANASLEAGDISDGGSGFHQLKLSMIVGLRIGLPPSGRQKLRVDYGVGGDQTTFVIQFGEVF